MTNAFKRAPVQRTSLLDPNTSAHLLVHNQAHIKALWKEAMQGHYPSLDLDRHTFLQSKIPSILMDLESALANPSYAQIPPPLIPLLRVAPKNPSLLDRYSIDQVFFEFGILQQVIFKALRLEGQLSDQTTDTISSFVIIELLRAAKRTHKQLEGQIRYEQQESEKQLWKARDSLRATFSHSSVGMAIVNPDGHFTKVNEALTKLTEYSEEELLARTIFSIMHPAYIERTLEYTQKLFKGEISSFEFEKKYIKKGGGCFWALCSASPSMGPSGRITSVIVVAQDITRRKEMEEEHSELLHISQRDLKTSELERELRDKFVSTLTHDLRTPLTSAKTSAELILKLTSTLEGAKDHSKRVISNLDRVDRMIQDLLDVNRLKAGKPLPLNISRCNLYELAKETLKELSLIYSDRFILQADSDIWGFWDSEGLKRILENLSSNAVKYGSSATPIHIRIRHISHSVQIEVHNFGNTLSKEDQRGLFVTFHRASTANGKDRKGWGLGLTLVRGITEAHGGTVRVQSEPSEGTSFIVTLPEDSRQFQSSSYP